MLPKLFLTANIKHRTARAKQPQKTIGEIVLKTLDFFWFFL
jgi:hypothetical protein